MRARLESPEICTIFSNADTTASLELFLGYGYVNEESKFTGYLGIYDGTGTKEGSLFLSLQDLEFPKQ